MASKSSKRRSKAEPATDAQASAPGAGGTSFYGRLKAALRKAYKRDRIEAMKASGVLDNDGNLSPNYAGTAVRSKETRAKRSGS